MRNALIDVEQMERAVATDFRLPALTSCTLIGHAFNDTYLLRTETDRFIGRVYLNGKYYIKESTDFLFELELLEFVRARGVSVAAPVRRRDGSLLGRMPGHDRVYAVFEYAAGEQAETVNLNQAWSFGAELARFHLAADEFDSPHHRYELGVEYLLERPYALIQRARDNGSPDIDEALAELEGVRPVPDLIDVVRELPTANGAYGIIHADLHPHNAHFNGDLPTFFDFDHCAYGWRAYDVAVLRATLGDEAWEAALAGYESVRVLSPDEHAALPALVDVRKVWDPGDILAMQPAWEGRWLRESVGPFGAVGALVDSVVLPPLAELTAMFTQVGDKTDRGPVAAVASGVEPQTLHRGPGLGPPSPRTAIGRLGRGAFQRA